MHSRLFHHEKAARQAPPTIANRRNNILAEIDDSLISSKLSYTYYLAALESNLKNPRTHRQDRKQLMLTATQHPSDCKWDGYLTDGRVTQSFRLDRDACNWQARHPRFGHPFLIPSPRRAAVTGKDVSASKSNDDDNSNSDQSESSATLSP